jgi:hypothetical protein
VEWCKPLACGGWAWAPGPVAPRWSGGNHFWIVVGGAFAVAQREGWARIFCLKMRITHVRCHGCGAGLTVNETVRFVTCNYCNAQSEVVHEPSVTHTKLLEEVVRSTEHLASRMKVVELQNDLLKLERDWDQVRERCLIRDQQGTLQEPSVVTAKMIAGAAMIVIPVLTYANAQTMDVRSALLIGGVLAAVAFFVVRGTLAHAREYESTKAAYRKKRHKLSVALIEERRQGSVREAEV